MAAPSKNFTTILDTQIDADSPLDTTLLTSIRDSLIHLEEWLGLSYTAAQDHDHDGTNSKLITTVAAAAIAQSQLKTAIGSVSTNVGANLTLPGGSYGFYPQFKRGSAPSNSLTSQMASAAGGILSYATNIYLFNSGASGQLSFAQQRYIQASPPYKIGSKRWGHFLFLLKKISTGEIVSAYQAEDPPWAYNGSLVLPKDDKRRIQALPHPFLDYINKAPSVDGLRIVLVDLSQKNVKAWRDTAMTAEKDPLENVNLLVKSTGKVRSYTAKGLPTISGFTDKIEFEDA